MADTTVKFLHSAMPGAPVLTGQAGSLIGMLDACLVNGFGSGTVDSIVIAGGIATVTRGAGHPAEVGTVMLIAGATVSGGTINGEQKALTVVGNTYTFDATGLADQTATGTITHKVASAGWEKTFSGTNLAVYKPLDVTATGCSLRVDDTSPQSARVVGYEAMADINTGTGPFPTAAQIGGGGYWQKSNASDATARAWSLASDGKMFYLLTQHTGSTSTSVSSTAAFGDPLPVGSVDPYGCVISCAPGAYPTGTGNGTTELDVSEPSGAAPGLFMARSITGFGGAIQLRKMAHVFGSISSTPRSGSPFSGALPFPNPADGALYVGSLHITEHLTSTFRARLPGFYYAPQAIGPSVFAPRDRVEAVAGLPGRTLRAMPSPTGVFFVDSTGPWRE